MPGVKLPKAFYLAAIFVLALSVGIRSTAQNSPQPLSDEEFQKVIHSSDTLDWMKIRQLTNDQARTISNSKGFGLLGDTKKGERRELWLRGLAVLSDSQAQILSKSKAENVYLDGLDTLTEQQATAVSNFEGRVTRLPCVKISHEGKEPELYNPSGIVSLGGLMGLSDEVAKRLGKSKAYYLFLNGLATLSDKQAKYLANFGGCELQLDGVGTLTEAAARALAECNCQLRVNALDLKSRSLLKLYGGNLIPKM